MNVARLLAEPSFKRSSRFGDLTSLLRSARRTTIARGLAPALPLARQPGDPLLPLVGHLVCLLPFIHYPLA
jgi:hypothetical protein